MENPWAVGEDGDTSLSVLEHPHTLQHHVHVCLELSVNTTGQGGHSLKLSCQHMDLLPRKVGGHWL